MVDNGAFCVYGGWLVLGFFLVFLSFFCFLLGGAARENFRFLYAYTYNWLIRIYDT